jgi:hypothetical protein
LGQTEQRGGPKGRPLFHVKDVNADETVSGGALFHRATRVKPVANPDLHQAIAEKSNEYSLNGNTRSQLNSSQHVIPPESNKPVKVVRVFPYLMKKILAIRIVSNFFAATKNLPGRRRKTIDSGELKGGETLVCASEPVAQDGYQRNICWRHRV